MKNATPGSDIYHNLGNSQGEYLSQGQFVPEDIFVSSSTRKLVEITVDLTISFLLAWLGVVTNILVIAVFAKQKFKDSVGVTMTAIAVWDFIKCLGCAVQRLSGPVSLADPAMAESWSNISVVVFTYLSCFSTYVSTVLAAYVAIERCLCVSIPFKVKWLITPKCSFIICCIISVVVFEWFAILYCVYDIIWVYSYQYNRTIAVYVNSGFFYQHKGPLFIFYNLSGIIWPVICFVIIVASTVVIIYHLRKSANFRSTIAQTQSQESQQKQPDNHISRRERQVVKMLLVIIVIYVVCSSPRIAHYTISYFVYDFYFLRRYHNIFTISAFILKVTDLANGSTNLFIFLTMSSSFKATYQELFPFCFKSNKTREKDSKVDTSEVTTSMTEFSK